jgi:hypothetical protein
MRCASQLRYGNVVCHRLSAEMHAVSAAILHGGLCLRSSFSFARNGPAQARATAHRKGHGTNGIYSVPAGLYIFFIPSQQSK